MRIHNPFRDWTMESTIGLLFIIVTIVAASLFACVIGLAVMSLASPEPTQSTTQETITTGDVKRHCLVVKTGQHVDAIDCDLIDDMTGVVR